MKCKCCEHVCSESCPKCGPFAMQSGENICIECEERAIETAGDDFVGDFIYSLQNPDVDNPEVVH
jgi:hypothetical protein